MKVYDKIVISMSTGEVLEEVSYEYEGPIAEAKGGGGGGGTSGAVDFPAYMKTIHGLWLDRAGASTVAAGESVNELIHAGLIASPYDGEIAYDPDANITAFLAELAEFKVNVDAVAPTTDWLSYITAVRSEVDTNMLNETSITTVTNAHAAVLDDRLTTEVLPRFQVGMRDVNAVISSSFVVGQAVLEGFNTREVAEFDAKLRASNYGQRNQLVMQGVGDAIKLLQLKMNFKDSLTKTTIESYRIKTVMKNEELEEQLDIDDKAYKWGLELYQFGGNLLSSISGSAVSTQKTPSKTSTGLGGALSGAASGAMVGSMVPGVGTMMGAGIGGVLGLMGGM